jgi:hypothetical protein
LDEEDLLRRRVKWQAVKALIAVREMRSNAVKLKSADDCWLAQVKSVEMKLQKIFSKA